MDVPLNKLLSGWAFDPSLRSCAVTVITMLQSSISILHIISSQIKVFGYLFFFQSWHAVEQIVKRTVISDVVMLLCHNCNDNVTKHDLSNGRPTHRHG